MPLRPQRIRTYLMLFALALTGPLLALSIFGLERMASTEQAQIERRVLQAAQQLAADIDRELDRAVITLETLATSADLKRGDFAAFHAQALLALKRTRAAIVLVDRSYRQLVDTLKPYGETLPATADPATAQRVFDTVKPQVSNLFRGSISGRPVFNVVVPVVGPDNTVHYALIMSFQAVHIADVLRSARLDQPWISGVTDNDGIILARSERHDDFVGQPLPPDLLAQSRSAAGVFRTVNVAGDPVLRATVRSEFAGWLVSATVPDSYLAAPRQRGLLFAALLLGLALLLGAALAYMFGRLMARPLDAATGLALAVGAGETVEPRRSALAEANLLMETLARASAELRRRAQHSEFLLRELAHRAKNQLAVIRGMALQTARQSASVDDFLDRFGRRIEGLAQSHEVLVRQNWEGAWMSDLVRAHLERFAAAERAEAAGPALFLDPAAVQNIGYALHELATNASKHGALAGADGRLSVTWQRCADGAIRLDWIERGVAGVTPPRAAGFGHRVITSLVPQSLQGSATLDFAADGLHWSLTFPGSHETTAPDGAAP